MNKKFLPLVMLLALTLGSCKFSEECDYTGSVELVMDWDSLWGDLQKPESLQALFYRNGESPIQKELLGDTVYNDIPSGDTELITYNHPANVQGKGFEILNNTELHLPTYFIGNVRAVNECPMLCSVTNFFTTPIDGTVRQPVAPLPIVKQLSFTVNVIKEGVTGEVVDCNASLSGVATGYSLGKKEPIRSKATVFFPLKRGKDDSFSHNFFVLGVNPDARNVESIPKKLTVAIALNDGETKSAELDLTDQLNEFTSNIFKCAVYIRISALTTDIGITSWEEGAWDHIVIQ